MPTPPCPPTLVPTPPCPPPPANPPVPTLHRVNPSVHVRLRRVYQLELEDKGQRNDVRVGGWADQKPLSQKKITYAAKDGMASFILGKALSDRRGRQVRQLTGRRKRSSGAAAEKKSSKPQAKKPRFQMTVACTSLLGQGPNDKTSLKHACLSIEHGGLLADTLKNTAGGSVTPVVPNP